MVNYLDRTVLGIAAPYLTKELGLTAASMGIVFSAFSWSYALLQIPGGIFLDRFGTRIDLFARADAVVGVHRADGCGRSLPMLLFTRIGVGVFEAPCFPANSRILATWFPQQERARANSIYSVGQYAGIAFLSVPLFWITQQFGWRGLFFIAGGFGILLGVLFWWIYREPSEDPHVGADEVAHIEAGGGGEYKGASGRVQLERHRPAAAPSPDHRRVDRTVRRQLDAGVLRDLVPDLPRQRPRHELHQRRHDDDAAVHRRVDRRAGRGPDLGSDAEADRLGQPRAQAADRRRHAAGVDDRRSRTSFRPAPTRWSSRSCRSRSSARA